MSLRPWQVEPANRLLYILSRGQNAVDLSDCGCGKTAHAAHVIANLKLPTLVIAPKIACTSWQRMLTHFGTSATITNWEAVTVGNTLYGTWEKPVTAAARGKFYFQCQNCQRKYKSDETPDRCYATGHIHCFVRKPVKHKRGRFSFAPQVKFVVFDEAQRATAVKSLNSELVIAARRQQIKTLGLSATLATTPLQFRAWGYSLGLFDNPDTAFFSWSRRHGCGKLPALPGWRWLAGADRQREIMASINQDILPSRGVRLTTASIPGFQSRTVDAELYDIADPAKIDALYAELAGMNALTEQLRIRQALELLKVDIAVELCNDALEKGTSCAIFVSFSATLAELRKRLNCDCYIDGTQTAAERQRCLDDFQTNRAHVIVTNSKAGGACCDMHDLYERARLGLIFPSFSIVELLQICGRLHRDGALSAARYLMLLVAGSIEENIKKALDCKGANLSALHDSDLTPIAA